MKTNIKSFAESAKGFTKSPLGIIALFIVLVYGFATLAVSFASNLEEHVLLLIYFLVFFPLIVFIGFLWLVSRHHDKIYGPSDFKDEENFIKIFMYDQAKGDNIEVKLKSQDTASLIMQQINDLSKSINTRISNLENSILINQNPQKEKEKSSQDSNYLKSLYDYAYINLSNTDEFENKMKSLGYNFKKYNNTYNNEKAKDHESIWLGKNLPLEIAKEVIKESKNCYPHLKFIHISGDINDQPPFKIHNSIFIGGSSDTAKEQFCINPMSKEDFNKIETFNTIEELHEFIRTFYIN